MAEPASIQSGDANALERRRRSRLTDEERRARQAEAKRQRRALATDEDRARQAEAQRRRRARLDEEKKAAIREAQRLRAAARRQAEREEQAERRRAASRLRMALQRETETEEAKAARREADRRRKAAERAQRRHAETLWQHGTISDELLSCDVIVRDEDAIGAVCSVCDRLWFGSDSGAAESESDGVCSGDAVKTSGVCPTCRLTVGSVSLPLQTVDVRTAPLESAAPGGLG